ncbi:hypothetical protein [Cesiribacter andamanensis]|nr:hypothetical protein [Cesiribacter andamanensis]
MDASLIQIPESSPDPGSVDAHLRPIIDFLIARGNQPLSQGFNKDKWGLRSFSFKKPLPAELIRRKFSFPENIKVAEYNTYGGAVVVDMKHALIIRQEGESHFSEAAPTP